MQRITTAIVCLLVAALLAFQAGSRGVDWAPGLVSADASSSVIVADAASLNGAPFPDLTGRVVDQAGMLDTSQKNDLERRLAAHELQSSDQVVVATISSLQGDNLEDYANRLFRYWQLGQAGENNGVLLLISRDDRKIRIEVGYGLEGILTDALSKTIIDLGIVPKFRQGDFAGGIVDGADLITKVLSGDTAELEARKERTNTGSDQTDWFEVAFFALWFTLFFGSVGFSILAPIYGKKLGKGRYKWLGIEMTQGSSSGSSSGGWSSSGGGGFSGGGGSSGGGGASGGW
jgi:uncharacterized protein